MLLVGSVARVRDHTVTGMLQAAGLAGVWHHSRAHDVFARRRWDPDTLGLALLDFLVTVFVPREASLRFAVDETLFGRSGRRVFGAHYLHDGAQPEGSGRRTRWGNCWVVVVLVVSLPCLGGRQVALPVLFRMFRPRDDAHPDRRSQPELARALVELMLKRFPGRTVELVMDGAYASRAWRGLPDRVSVTTRMRANAALHKPAPTCQPGRQGRPPLKGAKLPTLAEIAERATFKPVTVTGPDGRQRTVHVHELNCLWYKPFHTRPVKVILIRNPGTSEGFDVAIASHRRRHRCRHPARPLRQSLDDRDPQPRSQGPRRRPGPQPRPASRRADRPVRVPRPDNHNRLVPAPRRPRHRPQHPPPDRPLVPAEDHDQLHRHARRAPPRTDPPPVSDTSTPDRHQPETHASPVTVSSGSRLRSRKSRNYGAIVIAQPERQAGGRGLLGRKCQTSVETSLSGQACPTSRR